MLLVGVLWFIVLLSQRSNAEIKEPVEEEGDRRIGGAWGRVEEKRG